MKIISEGRPHGTREGGIPNVICTYCECWMKFSRDDITLASDGIRTLAWVMCPQCGSANNVPPPDQPKKTDEDTPVG